MSATNKELSTAVLALEQINIGTMQQNIDTLSESLEESKNEILNNLDILLSEFEKITQFSEDKVNNILGHITTQSEILNQEVQLLQQQLEQADEQIIQLEDQIKVEAEKLHNVHENHLKELNSFDEQAEQYAQSLEKQVDTWLNHVDTALELFEKKEDAYNNIVQNFVQLGETQLKQTAEDIKAFDLKIQNQTENMVNQLTDFQNTISNSQHHLMNINIISSHDSEEEQIQKVFEYLSASGIKFEDVFGKDMKKILDVTSDIVEVIEKIKPILDIIKQI